MDEQLSQFDDRQNIDLKLAMGGMDRASVVSDQMNMGRRAVMMQMGHSRSLSVGTSFSDTDPSGVGGGLASRRTTSRMSTISTAHLLADDDSAGPSSPALGSPRRAARVGILLRKGVDRIKRVRFAWSKCLFCQSAYVGGVFGCGVGGGAHCPGALSFTQLQLLCFCTLLSA